MTTVADLIDSTRQHLYGTYRAEFNFLSSAATDSATTINLEISPLTGVTRGSLLAINDELLYVKSVSGQTVTVARGWNGTTAAAHIVGDTVEVNPRFPQNVIRDALQADIRSWGQQLYWEDTITVSGVATTRGYDLTSIGDFYNISDVYRAPYAADLGNTWPSVDFTIRRKLPTSSFASGSALFIASELASAASLQVVVQKPFVTSTFADATDIETTCKLPVNLHDIPPYGAAWRLLSTREIKRTFTDAQPESRLAAEVPPGHTDQTAARLKRLRDDRIEEEAGRLRSKTPLRF